MCALPSNPPARFPLFPRGVLARLPSRGTAWSTATSRRSHCYPYAFTSLPPRLPSSRPRSFPIGHPRTHGSFMFRFSPRLPAPNGARRPAFARPSRRSHAPGALYVVHMPPVSHHLPRFRCTLHARTHACTHERPHERTMPRPDTDTVFLPLTHPSTPHPLLFIFSFLPHTLFSPTSSLTLLSITQRTHALAFAHFITMLFMALCTNFLSTYPPSTFTRRPPPPWRGARALTRTSSHRIGHRGCITGVT
ncbi:hypothetical protein BD413DRAFT_3687 [Trametes elegans]|nr:hypothetical protein BD413DRAFT_3687 [Trametes elegans]